MARTKLTPAQINTGAQGAIVATSETTAAQTYTDLTTTTDTVTVTIGVNGQALVSIFSYILVNAINSEGYVSFVASGANTIAAADATSIFLETYAGNAEGQYGATFLLTGLTPGSTTFKMKYRATANTATFKNRRISVVPL